MDRCVQCVHPFMDAGDTEALMESCWPPKCSSRGSVPRRRSTWGPPTRSSAGSTRPSKRSERSRGHQGSASGGASGARCGERQYDGPDLDGTGLACGLQQGRAPEQSGALRRGRERIRSLSGKKPESITAMSYMAAALSAGGSPDSAQIVYNRLLEVGNWGFGSISTSGSDSIRPKSTTGRRGVPEGGGRIAAEPRGPPQSQRVSP